MKIYLAGAIRDDIKADIEWRELMIHSLNTSNRPVQFLNPLAGKVYDAKTKLWTVHNMSPDAKMIVKHDFWCVDHADIIVFNFQALTQKYPMIGSLIEFGHATAKGCLLYSIIDPDYTGHDNQAMFKLHPFIEQNSALIFNSVVDCMIFLDGHINVLEGRNPHYGKN